MCHLNLRRAVSRLRVLESGEVADWQALGSGACIKAATPCAAGRVQCVRWSWRLKLSCSRVRLTLRPSTLPCDRCFTPGIQATLECETGRSASHRIASDRIAAAEGTASASVRSRSALIATSRRVHSANHHQFILARRNDWISTVWHATSRCDQRRRAHCANRTVHTGHSGIATHPLTRHRCSLFGSHTPLSSMYASLHMAGGGDATGSSFTALGSSARSASSIARAIRAEEYSLRNRIKSLVDDRAFVASVRNDYPSLPLFANLRCGVWYVESCSSSVAGDASAVASAAAASSAGSSTAEACYFKSTDGHVHHWKFSAARLNVHVLQRIIQHTKSGSNNANGDEPTGATASPHCSGALFVDSTRKGKRFPDSFSRTMPIWCAVWNRALLEVRQRNANATAAAVDVASGTPASDDAWDTALHMPLWVRSVLPSPIHAHSSCLADISSRRSSHSIMARIVVRVCFFFFFF